MEGELLTQTLLEISQESNNNGFFKFMATFDQGNNNRKRKNQKKMDLEEWSRLTNSNAMKTEKSVKPKKFRKKRMSMKPHKFGRLKVGPRYRESRSQGEINNQDNYWMKRAQRKRRRNFKSESIRSNLPELDRVISVNSMIKKHFENSKKAVKMKKFNFRPLKKKSLNLNLLRHGMIKKKLSEKHKKLIEDAKIRLRKNRSRENLLKVKNLKIGLKMKIRRKNKAMKMAKTGGRNNDEKTILQQNPKSAVPKFFPLVLKEIKKNAVCKAIKIFEFQNKKDKSVLKSGKKVIQSSERKRNNKSKIVAISGEEFKNKLFKY